jgi:hypothetical protein
MGLSRVWQRSEAPASIAAGAGWCSNGGDNEEERCFGSWAIGAGDARPAGNRRPLTEHDLPIDSHVLIARAAPRPIFIGASTIDTGDDWVDPKGSFLAAAAASPAWSLLGRRGLSTFDFPSVLTAVIESRVGF